MGNQDALWKEGQLCGSAMLWNIFSWESLGPGIHVPFLIHLQDLKDLLLKSRWSRSKVERLMFYFTVMLIHKLLDCLFEFNL